jgi:putative transposase
VRERRDQLRHPAYSKPELLAISANQVWSWDITKLKGPVKWTYYYLYVILDIFSRYVVGWMVATRESSELAKRLIDETCDKQGAPPLPSSSPRSGRPEGSTSTSPCWRSGPPSGPVALR